jgi:DNA adenine methylase
VNVKPILKYPGAKWNIAPWIVSHFPEHYHYLEPYCGSAAVFFAKPPVHHEVLNDISGSIVNLFTMLRERGDELARMIDLTPWSEAEYHASEHHFDDTGDTLEDARRFLIRIWQAHGGAINQVSGWAHDGILSKRRSSTTRRWHQLPERLLAVVDRLKDAEIRNRPALEMIAYYNDPDCLIYADPPYLPETRTRKHYQHEMTAADHIELLEALRQHRGSVILSGYIHPLYDSMLADWHRTTTMVQAEHGNTRQEVLWLNPRAAQSRQLTFDFEIESEIESEIPA